MSEAQAHQDEELDHSAVEDLARFILSYDLGEQQDPSESLEPVVPATLRKLLNQTLEKADEGRQQVVYARLCITIEKRMRDGQELIFAGVSQADIAEQLDASPALGGAFMEVDDARYRDAPHPEPAPPEQQGFQEHFRGLRGEFYAMRPRDLIQFFCSCGTTVEVYFTNERGERGEVLIERGTVLHVEVQGLTGNEAAQRIMEWESGNFITRPLRETPPMTLDMTWIHLLLEHARAIDESGEHPTVDYERMDEAIEGLPNWMDAG